MPVAHMAELEQRVLAGMYDGHAHGAFQLHCVVAQELASCVLSVLLMVVAFLVGVLFDCSVQLLFGMVEVASSPRSSCWLSSSSPKVTQLMLLCDLPGAGFTTIVGASIFVVSACRVAACECAVLR